MAGSKLPLLLLASLAGGAIAVAVTFLARDLSGVPIIAELVVDASTQVLQPRGFSYLLAQLGHLGKPLLFLGVVLAELIGFVFAWWLAGRLVAGSLPMRAFIAVVAAWCLRFTGSVALVSTTEANLEGFSGFAIVNALACLAFGAVAWVISESPPEHEGYFSSARRAFLLRVPVLVVAGGAAVVVLKRLSASAGGGVQYDSLGKPTAEVTSNEHFYVISKNLIDPNVSADRWRLRVGGVSSRMLDLSYEDLLALPSQEQYTTLQCISNGVGGPLMSNALWKGVPLRELLGRAQPLPSATHVMFRSDDDYTESLSLEFAMRDGVMLAHTMNGERLPKEHGFPLRLLAPGKYGMNQPKWITEIVLLDKEMLGYWGRRGWEPTATMKTGCRIDVPVDFDVVSGPTRIVGVAFSGDRGISRVEVSVDNGKTWREAVLKPALSPYTWVLWHYDWTDVRGEGRVELQARATDGRGELQSAIDRPSYPSGATGYHKVLVKVRS
jgi:DMSO/TMAO reductase YedYZ molybdopterin-dependent catalytic subunit